MRDGHPKIVALEKLKNQLAAEEDSSPSVRKVIEAWKSSEVSVSTSQEKTSIAEIIHVQRNRFALGGKDKPRSTENFVDSLLQAHGDQPLSRQP